MGALTSILPIFYPPTSPEELHSEPRPDLNLYIIDSHRPWDLNNVFLKEGGVYCVDDGNIETGLAIEGGVGEDYAVLLDVRTCSWRCVDGRVIRLMMMIRGRRRRFLGRRRIMRRQRTRMENAVVQGHGHGRDRVLYLDPPQQVKMIH